MRHRKGVRLGHFRGGEDFASHFFEKYFSSRSSDCSIKACCLQKAKRTKVSGVPLLKKAESGISATPASRISRSQKAKSFSLVSLVMPAVKKYVPSQGCTSKPSLVSPAAKTSRFFCKRWVSWMG